MESQPGLARHTSGVRRCGDDIIRPAGPWTPAVHRLLRQLTDVPGLEGVPRPHRVTDSGHEVLSFVPGSVPAYPMPSWVWSHAALVSAAVYLRRVHDATVGIDRAGPWRSPVHQPVEVICHNDYAPYNLVFDGDHVVGAIDWDFASPGPRLWDLAYLAYRIVPLSSADWADGFGTDARSERLRALLEAYGSVARPKDLLEVLERRLLEVADYSDAAADERGPELREHAALYRRDAGRLAGVGLDRAD